MPQANVYNQTGEKVSTIELDANIFGLKPNRGLISQAVETILANRRVAIAHTKTRGDVRGGGKKPWKQKGTGRARHGSIRSPIWKGGGVTHGPKSIRNFSKKMNIQAKRQALRMVLSEKAAHDQLAIINDLTLAQPKTKILAGTLARLPKKKTTLIVTPKTDQALVRSSRNIPGVAIIRADSLNVYDLLRHQQLLILEPALAKISSTYAK
ncbi:MAG: 50S ribosomal protein L4 [Candidatus Kerfeldbacteria bacterium]|nr:50S ribosomal protein L4 [Candidatus Kerfeldbacteria bacterium]